MDFLIKREDKTIGLVMLSLETHFKMITKAKELNLDLILKFKEFYGNSIELQPKDFDKLNVQLLDLCRFFYEKKDTNWCNYLHYFGLR